jgi:hypothetical protein
MKTIISISFNALPIPGGAAAILTPSGCGPDVAEVSDYTIVNIRTVRVRLKLDENDERVAKVFALLKQHGVEVDSYTYTEYSNEDLQNARLLRMWPDANEFASMGLRYGTKYDLSEACANCGAGARQTSALYVDGDRLARIRKHRAIGSWEDHILVDGGMVKKLKDAGVTGMSFGDVRARLRNEKWTSVARDQILIEHTMPPMRGESPADQDQRICKVCRRGGHMSWLNKFYREEDLVGMRDFNLTWEWFGTFGPADKERGRVETRSSPRVFVTPKVMNVFRDAGVTTFDWTPAAIEE